MSDKSSQNTEKMQNTNDEKIRENITDAQTTLARVITWINDCDSKTATVLALVGVILTIMLTNDGIVTIKAIIKNAINLREVSGWLFIAMWSIATSVLLFGFLKLISVLIASTKSKDFKERQLTTNSKIFFGSIARLDSFEEFRNDYEKMSLSKKLNDLLSQIYINSQIADEKYKKYNCGLKWTIMGFACFIILFVVGFFIYY